MAAADLDMEKVSYEIFSILESKFLFGYDDPKRFLHAAPRASPPATPGLSAKVRILSVDAGGATDGLLAAASLVRLESSLRRLTGDSSARICDFFDVAAGSGLGGVLVALLFTAGPGGRPPFSAADAFDFLVDQAVAMSFGDHRSTNYVRIQANLPESAKFQSSTDAGELLALAEGLLAQKNVESVLFWGKRVSQRTNAESLEWASAVLVVSLGNGEAAAAAAAAVAPGGGARWLKPDAARIASEGAADMVDQAVAMSFGDHRSTNYVRIQANLFESAKFQSSSDAGELLAMAEGLLAQKNVESVLFWGKRVSQRTNAESLEWASAALVIRENDGGRTKEGSSPRSSSSSLLCSTSGSPMAAASPR